MESWESGQSLMQETKFIIFDRNGDNFKRPHNYERATTDLRTVSSTEVRSLVKQRKPIDDLVTVSVAKFIEREGLYL